MVSERAATEAPCDFRRLDEQLFAVLPSAMLRQYPGDDRDVG